MVSRRSVLEAGSVVALAALAGCVGGDTAASDDTTSETTPTGSTTERAATADNTTADGTTADDTTVEKRILAGDTVQVWEISAGATVAVATPDLRELVETAANTDGRVDYEGGQRAERDQTFVLGAFDFLRFRGETYESSASFAGFATEASYRYELEPVTDSDIDDADADVLDYEALNDSERAIADEMLDTGDFTVGRHDDVPAAARTFTPQDYLRVDDDTYRIRVAVGDPPPHHMLTLQAAEPDGDAQVVTVADRVPEYGWTDALTAAVEDGDGGAVSNVENTDGLVAYVEAADYVVTATAVAEVGVVDLVE